MWMMLWHSLLHAMKDTAGLLPFLFVTYLAMEYLEHRAEEKSIYYISQAGKKGPLFGGVLGVIPQCGFSAASANLYAGGVITAGTMMAVFLSTSDEMLPLLISAKAPARDILLILGCKMLIGIVAGFMTDALIRRSKKEDRNERHIHDLCRQEHCHCEGGGILRSALKHCVRMALFIFLILLAVHILTEWIGPDEILRITSVSPALSVPVAGLLGMIPGCASSVAITTMYLEGMLSFGVMLAGLLNCSGVGLAILFRVNRNRQGNLQFAVALYAIGVCCGLLAELI